MLDYRVTTPENVDFHFTLAAPGTRMLAWLLDLGIVVTVLILAGGFGAAIASAAGGYADAFMALFSFVWFTGYWIVFEYRWQGRTPGKKIFGLRVVGERGLRLHLGQVVLRNLLRLIDLLPGFGGVGACFLLFHPEHRRLGDLVAGTVVVRERRVPAPDRLRGILDGGGPRSRSRLLPLDAGRRVGFAQRELMLDLCLRRDILEEATRMTLFSEVARDLRVRLDLDERAFGGVSDEKLVLLATSELYERS